MGVPLPSLGEQLEVDEEEGDVEEDGHGDQTQDPCQQVLHKLLQRAGHISKQAPEVTGGVQADIEDDEEPDELDGERGHEHGPGQGEVAPPLGREGLGGGQGPGVNILPKRTKQLFQKWEFKQKQNFFLSTIVLFLCKVMIPA